MLAPPLLPCPPRPACARPSRPGPPASCRSRFPRPACACPSPPGHPASCRSRRRLLPPLALALPGGPRRRPLPAPAPAALAFRLPPLALLLLLPALPALAFAVPALPRLRLPLASAVPCLPLPVRVPPRRLPWSLPLGPQPDLNETILSLPKARHSCLALGNAKPPTFDHAMRSLACFLGALGASTDSK